MKTHEFTLVWKRGAPGLVVANDPRPPTLRGLRDLGYLPDRGLRRRIRKAVRALCGAGWAAYTVRTS